MSKYFIQYDEAIKQYDPKTKWFKFELIPSSILQGDDVIPSDILTDNLIREWLLKTMTDRYTIFPLLRDIGLLVATPNEQVFNKIANEIGVRIQQYSIDVKYKDLKDYEEVSRFKGIILIDIMELLRDYVLSHRK